MPPNKSERILVIDDDTHVLSAIERMFRVAGYPVQVLNDPAKAVDTVAAWQPDLILLDVRMPISGFDLLRHFHQTGLDAEILVMTGYGTVEMAVQAVKDGAFDFISKPFDHPDTLLVKVQRALEHRRLVRRTRELERAADLEHGLIVGASQLTIELRKLVEKIAPSHGTVLISGETGVGKEVVARAIHRLSTRSSRPFLAVNCSALGEHLIESELFGHEKGSFTGAMTRRDGLFIEADRGTLFLDEIGEMPLNLQAKLLRVIQEGEVRRVGSNHTVKVDVRLVAATNRNLQEQVRKGLFREDLYYRLNVINVHIEPLRNRRDDIAPLTAHFLAKYQPGGLARKTISPKTLELLERYAWPGNVRELENVIQRALILTDGDIVQPRSLPIHLLDNIEVDRLALPLRIELPYQEAKQQFLARFDRAYVSALLEQTGGSLSRAAQLAGMDRSNFRKLVLKAGARAEAEGGSRDEAEEKEEALP